MSTCLLLAATIFHLSSGQTMDKLDITQAFERANQTTTLSTNWTKVSSEGYKSHYGPLSSIILNGSVACIGAFACAKSTFMSGSNLNCDADSSCSKISNIQMIHLHKPYVYVGGAHGLIHSTVSYAAQLDILCRGEQSCAHSALSGFASIYAGGAYSLLNASVDSANGTANVSIDFSGYYAGFGVNFTCRPGQLCTIQCYSTGCSNMHLNCDDNCIIYGMLNPIPSIQNVLLYDSFIISQQNDAECSAQIDDMTFDDAAERKRSTDVLNNPYGGPICCRGFQSCDRNDIQYTSSSVNESIICSGKQACPGTSISSNGPVFCGGLHACSGAHIATTGILYCNADRSCRNSFIFGPSLIYCTGYGSCDATLITSNGTDLNLYLLGLKAGTLGNVTCSESDECYIFCGGYHACSNLTVVCDGTCNVYCDKHSMCPNGWNYTPTAVTTIDPTQSPITATLDPSSDPSSVLSSQGTTPSEFEVEDKLNLSLIIITSVIVLCLIIIMFLCLIIVKRRRLTHLNEQNESYTAYPPNDAKERKVEMQLQSAEENSSESMEGMKVTQEGAPDDDHKEERNQVKRTTHKTRMESTDGSNKEGNNKQQAMENETTKGFNDGHNTSGHREFDNIADDEFVVKGDDYVNDTVQ